VYSICIGMEITRFDANARNLLKTTNQELIKTVKVRVCLKCKHFVVIKDGSFKNQQAVKLFERDHQGHNMGTLDYNEVSNKASGYESKTNIYQDKTA
jgi:hypothetical protein